jgi:hypothetical protein
MLAARRWAVERAEFANVNFREIDRTHNRYQDAPFIAEDFLGTANPDRKTRTADMLAKRRAADMENVRLADKKRLSLVGGGSTRVENGIVIVSGVPDVFRELKEKHEAELAKRGKRG